METQIKQLKLSATNIKGTLIRGNKELKKLRIREKNIFNRQRISEKRLQKESFVEGGIPGSGMVAGQIKNCWRRYAGRPLGEGARYFFLMP